MSASFKYFSKKVFFLRILFRKNLVLNHKVFYSENASTTIDGFTENLVLEKGIKWDNLLKISDKHSAKLFLKTCETKIEDQNLTSVTKNEDLSESINNSNLLLESVSLYAKENNIPELIVKLELCKSKNCCPSKEQLLYLAKLFTTNKNKNGIKILQHLCKINYPLEYKIQSHYEYFEAEVIWSEGNVKESLNLFAAVYCDNVMLRSKIKIMLCNHFSEIVINHGEASRIIAINFVKIIADKCNDYSLMGYFWKVLFESEWFSDQQLSSKFLKENHELKHVIGWMLPVMGRQILQENKLDTFYRLIEVLLTNEMKQHCGHMLRLLFDYKYNLRDLRGCTSIVKACSDLDLPLTERQGKKFLNLLLNMKPKLDKSVEFAFKF